MIGPRGIGWSEAAAQAAFDAYLAGPERQAHRAVLDGVEVTQRLLQCATS